MEICDETVTANCPDCPYDIDCENVPGEDLRADAVFYLKQYRSDKLMWEADRKGYLDWIERYKDARDKHQQAVIELKRKPVKVINIYSVGNYLFGSCGGCGAPVIKHEVYCSECGVKLDWGE